jgi:hypothetical protein
VAIVLVTTVHTTGVNWESIATVFISMMVVVGAYSRWIIGRLDSIRERVQKIEIELAKANGRQRRWWR